MYGLRDKLYLPTPFGASSIAATAVARFIPPGYVTGTAPTTTVSFRSPSRPTIWKNLQVHARVAGVGAATLTFTILVNGVATTLSAAGVATLTDWNDLTHVVLVPANALIDLQSTKSAAITTSPADILASVEVYPAG
jgi:hypothetical protein